MVSDDRVDAICGDWPSELNIAWNAIRKYEDPTEGYEVGFLEQLDDCIDIIAEKKMKLVSNAGALNTPECAQKAKEIRERLLSVVLLTLEPGELSKHWRMAQTLSSADGSQMPVPSLPSLHGGTTGHATHGTKLQEL